MSEDTAKDVHYEYDTLVISGGSTKGLLAFGALQYAIDNHLLKHVTTYVGTSIGSIISFMLAIGYSPTEVMVYICTHQLLEKMKHFNIVAMINGEGASSYAHIQEQIEKMTIAKIGYLPTLKNIREKFGKTLICITHNFSTCKTIELSPDSHPDLPCLTAIRMSSNLPFIFEKYKYGDHFFVDGGVANNFPIDVGDRVGKKILGIVLLGQSEKEENSNPDEGILADIYQLMFTPIKQAMEYRIANASNRCRIVKLRHPEHKLFNFNISATEKLNMFSNGYNTMRDEFNVRP
jgi:predicted acylesterase/phospholipase RssA